MTLDLRVLVVLNNPWQWCVLDNPETTKIWTLVVQNDLGLQSITYLRKSRLLCVCVIVHSRVFPLFLQSQPNCNSCVEPHCAWTVLKVLNNQMYESCKITQCCGVLMVLNNPRPQGMSRVRWRYFLVVLNSPRPRCTGHGRWSGAPVSCAIPDPIGGVLSDDAVFW